MKWVAALSTVLIIASCGPVGGPHSSNNNSSSPSSTVYKTVKYTVKSSYGSCLIHITDSSFIWTNIGYKPTSTTWTYTLSAPVGTGIEVRAAGHDEYDIVTTEIWINGAIWMYQTISGESYPISKCYGYVP